MEESHEESEGNSYGTSSGKVTGGLWESDSGERWKSYGTAIVVEIAMVMQMEIFRSAQNRFRSVLQFRIASGSRKHGFCRFAPNLRTCPVRFGSKTAMVMHVQNPPGPPSKFPNLENVVHVSKFWERY